MINIYRKIAMIEGISYLVLIFIAMPMKYIFHIPEPVKYFGWLHGLLFIIFLVLLIYAAIKYSWKISRVLGYFLASLVPFVPFILDKKLEKEYSKNFRNN